MKACVGCQPCERAQETLRRAAEQHVERKRPRLETPTLTNNGLPVYDTPKLVPLQWNCLDPVEAFGNKRTYVFFQFVLHAGAFSHDKAKHAIAHELTTTDGADEPLLLEAGNGLRHGYAICDTIAEEIGMAFTQFEVPIRLKTPGGEITFTARLHLRSILGCCKLLFARVQAAARSPGRHARPPAAPVPAPAPSRPRNAFAAVRQRL